MLAPTPHPPRLAWVPTLADPRYGYTFSTQAGRISMQAPAPRPSVRGSKHRRQPCRDDGRISRAMVTGSVIRSLVARKVRQPSTQSRSSQRGHGSVAHCRRPAVAGIGNVAAIQRSAVLRDDKGNGGGRPRAPRNVLGDRLEDCSMKPITGFFRDGCCNTSQEDIGSHTVCAIMTAEFLEFSKSCGNDLSTPMPQFGFPGLRPGDRWCLCAPRWQEALEAGQAPRVVLRATHEGALDSCALVDLKRFAVDLA